MICQEDCIVHDPSSKSSVRKIQAGITDRGGQDNEMITDSGYKVKCEGIHSSR